MSRLHVNELYGTLSGALASGATTWSGTEVANLPTVTAPDLMAVTLAPNGNPAIPAVAPEIIHVTAHTAGATSATIARAQEGTVARDHTAGEQWVNALTAQDIALDTTAGDITTSNPGDAQSAGSTTVMADAGHRHGREAWASSVVAAGSGVTSAGSSSAVSRGDHDHGGAADPTNLGGDTIYRNSNDILIGGTATANATFSGAAANVIDGNDSTYWYGPGSANPPYVTVDCATAKTGNAYRVVQDSFTQHNGQTLKIQGSNDNVSFTDVVSIANTVGDSGIYTGAFTSTTYRYWRLTSTGNYDFKVYTFSVLGTALARLAIGTLGQFYRVGGSGSALVPDWETVAVPTVGGGTPSTQAFGDSAADGSSSSASREDHKHGMPTDPRGLPVGGGLAGATAATRYVGGTTTGHPTSGTFAVGDYVITQDGSEWICTAAGSPGTWTQISGGGGGGSSTLAGDTDVSISSPSDGQFLKYQSSDSKWHNVNLMTASGGMLLARTVYAPSTSQDYSVSSSTLTALDSTNLTVTFTAPASGVVVIKLHAEGIGSSGASDLIWGVGPHGGSGDTASATPISSNNDDTYFSTAHIISGLTPGTSYQYDWFHASGNGSATVHTYVGKSSNATKRAPGVMEVYDGATAINQVGVTAAMNANEAQASVISNNAASDHFFGTALASAWAQEATTATFVGVGNSCVSVQAATSSENHLLRAWAPGAIATTVETRVNISADTTSTIANNGGGLFIRDSGTGDASGAGLLVQVIVQLNSAGAPPAPAGYAVRTFKLASGTYTQQGSTINIGSPGWVYLRAKNDGSGNWTTFYSLDRANWYAIASSFLNNFTIAKVGFRSDYPNVCTYDFIDVVDGTVGPQAGLVSALAPASGAGQAVVSSSSSPYAPQWAGDTAWTNVTGGVGFQNSWVDYDSTPNGPVSFRKDALGFVHLRGYMKSGTIGSTAFTLPAGYRPSRVSGHAVDSNSAYGKVNVGTDGTVNCQVGSNTYVSLNGITFLGEQ